jgi:hypothetical protein
MRAGKAILLLIGVAASILATPALVGVIRDGVGKKPLAGASFVCSSVCLLIRP